MKQIKITAATVYITDIPVRLMRRHGSGDVAGSVKNAILKLETELERKKPGPKNKVSWAGKGKGEKLSNRAAKACAAAGV